MSQAQIFVTALFFIGIISLLLWVFWPRKNKKPNSPKYIISQNGYGRYFVREVFDEDYSFPIFIHRQLMTMAQVDNAIAAYEEFQSKSVKKEVKRIY